MISRAPYLLSILLISFIAGIPSASALVPFGPGPERSSFAVSDFMIGYPFGPAGGPDRRLDLSTELGWLFSVSDRLHIGPTFQFGSWLNGGWHSRWSLHARLRLDLDDRFSVTLSPGLIIADSPAPTGFAGYTAGATLMMDDWIGLTAGLDLTSAFPEGRDAVVRLGVGIGSLPGLCMSAAAGAAGAVAYWLSGMD